MLGPSNTNYSSGRCNFEQWEDVGGFGRGDQATYATTFTFVKSPQPWVLIGDGTVSVRGSPRSRSVAGVHPEETQMCVACLTITHALVSLATTGHRVRVMRNPTTDQFYARLEK